MFDFHRHDHFSYFDGFGKAMENAIYAKSIGYTALGLTNHGNINGLVQHYSACKEQEIKPIMGFEAYFQPVIDKEKPRYHLCIVAKNLKGYSNLCALQLIGQEQMYYKPIVTFKDLKEHAEGLIVSSACVGGYISQMIAKDKNHLAIKAIKTFKKIFDDDFYIEIQPYKLSEVGLQERVNVELIQMSKDLDVKCIMTSDSHYANPADWNSYLKMHEMSHTGYDVESTYKERYMPTEEDIKKRFMEMHWKTDYAIECPVRFMKGMMANLQEIEDKVEPDIITQLPMVLPKLDENIDSYKMLLAETKKGLKERGKFNKEYIDRCKEELNVINTNGYTDYFLIVQDYVLWAKGEGIRVGPGRGSVCNCQVAWALGITDVDSLKFNLEFRRFMRLGKKKMPDIDLDFETSRRAEVIEYIVKRYDGHAAQICSYGLYKIDNLINELSKVCFVEEISEIKEIKKIVNKHVVDGSLHEKELMEDRQYKPMNKLYDDILLHFIKMYKKIKYIGTHAAGVAVTGGNIEDYTGLKRDTKTGKIFTSYDLADLSELNVIKFDILGLNTMEQIGELIDLTGESTQDDWFEDERLFEEFAKGNTDGIFQFEKNTAKQILIDMKCDCFEDVIAASSMNRPGPLSEGTPQKYAENKFNVDEAKKSKYYKYTKETYGTIVYQEQIQQICVNIGMMSWDDAEFIMKMIKGGNMADYALRLLEQNKQEMMDKFTKGALTNGFTKKEATDLFENLMVYSFNKGHGTGYSIISLEEMHYKIYWPNEYWYVKCKYAGEDSDRWRYSNNAVKDGALLFLPHVNYSSEYTLRKVDGDNIIQEGMSSVKFVGKKAADFIEFERREHGYFKSKDDFIERCKMKGSPVNKRAIEVLEESGALEFDKKTYQSRVIKYNSQLYMKGMCK